MNGTIKKLTTRKSQVTRVAKKRAEMSLTCIRGW
jgi:hypothetical protein